MKFSAVLLLFACFGNGIGRYSNTTNRSSYVTTKDPYTKTIEYYTDYTPRISIPIMIHLDKALTKNLSKDHRRTVRKYFQDVVKSAESIFKHPSLNQTINFKLLGVKLLRNSTMFHMNENVSKYLRSYCQWQGKRKVLTKKWYYSVLFTGLDVYYLDGKNKKVRSSTGRGYMRGVCSIRNSCTILEWHSQNIAFIMAHEIAHSLGINHDGPPYNQCRGQQYIMGAKYSLRNPATTWSPCNKHALKKFLKQACSILSPYAASSFFIRSKHSWCLQPNSAIKTF